MVRLAVSPARPRNPWIATLVELVGGRPGRRAEIDRVPFTIGSGDACSLVLTADDVAMHHCTIDRVSDGWELRVEGSATSATVDAAAVEVVWLRNGMEIGIGTAVLVFLEGETEAVAEQVHRIVYDLACRDGATRSMNERFMREVVARELGRDHGVGLVLVEIDGMDVLADAHSRTVLDGLLVRVARLLEARSPERAYVGRVGASAFAVAVESDVDPERLGTRLCDAIAVAEHDCRSEILRVTASVGVAAASVGVSAEAVWDAARRSLERARERGAGRVEVERVRGP